MTDDEPKGREMGRSVDIEEVRDMRDQILREMHAGFKGVHARQDRTNGRIDALQETAGELDGRLVAIERDEAVHVHRRATDPQPVTPPKVDAENKPITRREVGIVIATATAIAGAAAGAWRLFQWFVAKVGP